MQQNCPIDCIILEKVETWPEPVINFLDEKLDFFKRKATASYQESYRLAAEFDTMVGALRQILDDYRLLGFHCTRLTRVEIEVIVNHGMSLANAALLRQRIALLLQTNQIDKDLADLALSKSFADDKYRKDMLWFCFFEPAKAGKSGIGEFFEYWGGESLYRAFESQPQIKAKFKSLGSPCIIKAALPIRDLKKYIELCFVSIYEHYRGIEKESGDYEGYLLQNLAPENIAAIIKYPSEQFSKLSGCQSWNVKNF